MKLELKIKSIEEVTREKEDEELEFCRINAEDDDGNKTILITPTRPTGFKAGMKIKIDVSNPQKTL